MEYVTLKTNTVKTFYTQYTEPRNVTLAYDEKYNTVVLLGCLLHNTQLEINQELVDDLQELVNQIQSNKRE